MITDEKIEAALNYLASTIEEAAEARAQKEGLKEGRKVILAELEGECNEPTESAKARYALSQERYKEFLKGLQEAVRRDAVHTMRRATYETTIEAWRTQQSNIRAAGKVV